MQKDIVEYKKPFHALHFFPIDPSDLMMVSLLAFDQRIRRHHLLKKTFFAAQPRKDSQNAKALQNVKFLGTFEQRINFFCLELENFNHFLIAFFDFYFENMDRVRQILLWIGIRAAKTVIRDKNDLSVQINNVEVIYHFSLGSKFLVILVLGLKVWKVRQAYWVVFS